MNRRGFLSLGWKAAAAGLIVPELVRGRSMVSLAGVGWDPASPYKYTYWWQEKDGVRSLVVPDLGGHIVTFCPQDAPLARLLAEAKKKGVLTPKTFWMEG